MRRLSTSVFDDVARVNLKTRIDRLVNAQYRVNGCELHAELDGGLECEDVAGVDLEVWVSGRI